MESILNTVKVYRHPLMANFSLLFACIVFFSDVSYAQTLKGDPMKAVWAIGRLRTDTEREQAVDFAADLGFNTLVTRSATPEMVARAHTQNIRIIATVFPKSDDDFERANPHCLQKMRDFEYKVSDAMAGQPWIRLHGESYRWQSFLLRRTTLCFEHPESQAELKKRVERALEIADGIALDGFGFVNYYACFCDRCETLRTEKKTQNPDLSDIEIMAKVSTQTLVNVHRLLHDHAKSINPNAIVANHVWPLFLPDEYIGAKYKLDYCTQTISWFYPPEWRLERVEMEAAEMKRLENPDTNRFVPFIGIHDLPDFVRTSERLAKEIEIALKYGEGNLVISRLTTLQKHPNLAGAVKAALNR